MATSYIQYKYECVTTSKTCKKYKKKRNWQDKARKRFAWVANAASADSSAKRLPVASSS